MCFLPAPGGVLLCHLAAPDSMDFRQNQIWILVWIIWGYSLSVFELLEWVSNAVISIINCFRFTNAWCWFLISAFFVHFLFQLHYLFIYLWNLEAMVATCDALVLWMGRVSHDFGFAQFHVRFYRISRHAGTVFLNPVLIHWRAHQRL